MKFSRLCALFSCAVLSSALANPAKSTEPPRTGIYVLDDSARPAPHETEGNGNDRYAHAYNSALPVASEVRYAVVARDPSSGMTKVLFVGAGLTADNYQQSHRICRAYAFPYWNFHSDRMPFCRTEISEDDAHFKFEGAHFTFAFNDSRKTTGAERIAPSRKPTGEEVGACAISGVCDPKTYGHAVVNYGVEHFSNDFTLAAPRAYIDMLFLTKDTPVYAYPGAVDSVGQWPAQSFVAVLRTLADDLEVERITPDGVVSHQFARRDDLLNAHWVAQRAKTERYAFEAAVDYGEGLDTNERGTVVAIRVIDRKSGQIVQTLRDFYADLSWSADDENIDIIDANFDGHPDITTFGRSGGAGPNSTQNFFLYSPITGRFEFDQNLSEMPQIMIDTKRRLIVTGQRDGCCHHSSETYRYRANQLRLVADWDEVLAADGKWVVTTTGRLVNGKWVSHSTRKRARF